jgi:hypothetical protein
MSTLEGTVFLSISAGGMPGIGQAKGAGGLRVSLTGWNLATVPLQSGPNIPVEHAHVLQLEGKTRRADPVGNARPIDMPQNNAAGIRPLIVHPSRADHLGHESLPSRQYNMHSTN